MTRATIQIAMLGRSAEIRLESAPGPLRWIGDGGLASALAGVVNLTAANVGVVHAPFWRRRADAAAEALRKRFPRFSVEITYVEPEPEVELDAGLVY